MKLFLLVVIAVCVMAIYDARKLGEKFFSKTDKNKITKVIKIFSFLICIVCGIIYCIIK